MPSPVLYLYDDLSAQGWSPFAETRPVGELLFGAWTLRRRALRLFGVDEADHLGCSELDGFSEPEAGVPADLPDLAGPDGVRIWNSRAAAHPGERRVQPVTEAAVLRIGDEVAGLELPPGAPLPGVDALQRVFSGLGGVDLPPAAVEMRGVMLAGPWSLVEANAEMLALDLHDGFEMRPGPLPDGVYLQGPPHLSVGEGVEIGPGVVLDTRGGPIRLDDGCVVEGPARLVGPLRLGPECIVFGGALARLSAGPVCKLRGEIADSVICGYSNKAHDGFLGHALLGRWVNLGAGTTNSDLKNNYSTIRMTTGSGTHETGLVKVGVLLGDHVKTGIGTLFNTGTAVGAGSNVFGGGMPPKWVTPFSWWWPKGHRPFRFARFEEVARIAMGRRNQSWPEGMGRLYRRLHRKSWETWTDPLPPGA